MTHVVFTAADLSEMRAFNDANLKDSIALRHGTRTYEPGGTLGPIEWDADPVWTEPARVSPASTPQERLTAGSISEVKDFWAIMREGVIVPSNDADDVYRLEWTHDITGLTNPFLLYLRGTPLRSYRMLSKFLCSTVAPQ